MLSYSLRFIVMHVATVTYGRNCNSANQIETDTVQIQEPNQLSGQDHQGSQSSLIPDPARPRNRCCPYDFDSKLCQTVNDRLLCGYNRNVGMPANNDKPVDLSGGCRLRGGRLECGYKQGPFTNARRPPGWDEAAQVDEKNGNIISGEINSSLGIDKSLESQDSDANEEQIALKLFTPENKPRLHKLVDTTKKYNAATKCVEIHERVVCKTV